MYVEWIITVIIIIIIIWIKFKYFNLHKTATSLVKWGELSKHISKNSSYCATFFYSNAPKLKLVNAVPHFLYMESYIIMKINRKTFHFMTLFIEFVYWSCYICEYFKTKTSFYNKTSKTLNKFSNLFQLRQCIILRNCNIQYFPI